MSSHELPISIKHNAEELQDCLKDLKNWQRDIKLEDLKLTEKKSLNNQDIPPIRSKKGLPITKKDSENKQVTMKKNFQQNEKNGGSKRISSYDYAAWDKFVVDKALESESEDDSSEEEVNEKLIIRNTKDIKRYAESKKEKRLIRNSEEDINKIESAENLKEEGNTFYAQGNFSEAIVRYSRGIGLNPSNAFLRANRAMAYIKTKTYKQAEIDCSKALELDPNYIKAYLRRATTRVHLSNISGAIEDYKQVLNLEPWNKDAKRELEKINREILSSEEIPPLEEATPHLQKTTHPSKQRKKIKIEEVDSNKDEEISKPIHLQSKKPLVQIPIIEINSREELEDLLKEPKEKKTSKNIKPKESSLEEKKESEKPIIPKPPRTSHQFAQDWQKLSKFVDLKHLYLKSIPVSFFHGTELEVDLLIEIFEELLGDKFDEEEAACVVLALMRTRGFSLNVTFLDSRQKEGLNKVIQKIENCDSTKEKIHQLRDYL